MTAPDAKAIAERRARFRALHERGCFIIPNSWDAGTTHYFSTLGFKAVASSSAGYAWTLAQKDGALTLDQTLAHLRDLVAASDLPVNADFVDGFGATPADVAANVTRAIDTGIAGISIEDSYPPSQRAAHAEPLRPVSEGVERIKAARAAIDKSGQDVMLVGRAENFVQGRPDIDDAVARLKAYSEAGADILFAPGISTPEQIKAVVDAVAPKPVSLLVGGPSPLSLKDYEAMGVRRISVGGTLARVAWGATMRASELLAQGNFTGMEGPPGAAVNKLMHG
ncbi:hypothetical protein CspeluHIS016_0802110 [Cutaneotrichosporon spelunceum]|uniref:Phosphoenolpyruvate/pyruvate domain-containing protein n=1 Tax=Cutaneotrichosporon spelunceum TaxID=1672016 RepID=A0AAD3TZZ5_9TREE|nr:hypothetical protein CspeluHIS016_0802110 [Cutaneotrichosporon spelunceum]